ncbi:MAG: DUF484 family protein [Rhodospirillales bacterium]|nr:DUF484 family protein [Rhodospirillales bacterium]
MTQQLDEFLPTDGDANPPGMQLPTEEDVVAYLRRNPDFFKSHADIMSEVVAPERWTGDGVVDLQRVMLDRRTSEIDELRNCAQEVIETSRSNMSTQTRTHAAVLAAVTANGFAHLVQVLADDWPFLLDVDVVTIGFEPPHVPDPRIVGAGIQQLEKGDVDRFVGPDRDICLYRDISDDGHLFGSGAGLVKSAALARVRPSMASPVGIMALGSRGNVFHPGQGSELIGFLVRVLESLIHRELDRAE